MGGPAKRGAARNELATDAVKLKSEQVFIPAAGGTHGRDYGRGLMVLESHLGWHSQSSRRKKEPVGGYRELR